MASLQQVQAGLWNLVNNTVGLLPVDVALGWPPEKRLQDIATGAARSAISIFARRAGRDTTRWLPTIISTTVNPANITAALSTGLAPAILTISGAPNVGDAIGLGTDSPALVFSAGTVYGVVVSALSGDTAASLATKLADALNSDPILTTVLSADTIGNQVSITRNGVINLSTATANVGSQVREVGRRELEFQITIWAQTTDLRDIIGGPVDQMIAETQVNFGYAAADGSQVRLMFRNSFDIEDATLQDVYRRDFLVSLEYPVTVVDALYPILVSRMNGTELG